MKLILLPTLAFALAGTVNAAECYAQGGSKTCASKDGIWKFREWFCTQEWQGTYVNKLYNDNNGFSARFKHDGPFTSQQQCWDSTENIIKQCLGKKNGGTWHGSSVDVNVNFCA